MFRIASVGISLLALLSIRCEQRKRHHIRSISYDDRWFGFHFDHEPVSSIFDEKLTIIPCTYSLARKRETVVEWRRDSTPINTSDKRISLLANGSLSIIDASRSDEGVYQCAVHVTDHEGSTWTFLSNKALMRVRSPLRWKEQPKDTTIQEGKNGVLRCELVESDGAVVKWLKDRKEINESDNVLMNGHSGSMEIKKMRKEDEGVYSCMASRDKENIESSRGRLSISRGIEQRELHLLSSPVSRRVKEGDETVMECIPTGEGHLRVEWIKDGVKVEDEKQGIGRIGYSLHFPSVRFDQSGRYTCRIYDASDSIEASATLSVITAPHITSRPQDIVAVETTDVELECFSSGRPSPTLSWFKNGEMLVPSEYFVVDANKLRILGLVKTDQGIYECLVENEGGTAHEAAQLLVDSTDSSLVAAHSGGPVKVSAPLGLGVTVIGSREATLIWDAPIQRNGNILHYHLYYKEEGSDRERVVNSSERIGRLRDLHPSTTYLVRVAAENEAGIGDISPPITLTTKTEQEVPGRVGNLRATGIGSETIEVEWAKPSNEGATPLFYRLFYVRSDKKDEEKETQINVPSTAYTMHGMDKYTWYNIRVEAEGEKGAGLSSNTVVVRTLSDIPSMAPIDINARAMSTTSVKVTWKRDESQSNGAITGARMKMKTKARGSKATSIIMDSDRLEEIVEGLDAGTSYQFRIALVNENGTGPYSDWISVDTPLTEKDESVLGAPRDLSARAMSDSISLTWRPPSDESVLVRGYQIGWGLNVPDVESSRVEADVHEFLVTGLKPSRDYVISVRAWNRQGSGFPIYETVRTMASGGWMGGMGGQDRAGEGEMSSVLDSPLGVQASVLSPTSLRLEWADNPSLFNVVYNVKYMSKVDSGHTRFLNTSDTWIIVDKLKPGTEYEMGVRAMTPTGLSPWSMTVSQFTQSAAPSSSPRDVTILPAASGDPHAVTVNWQPPKYANGELTEYIVYYTDRGSAREEEWTSIRVPADRLSLPIDNLLPKATYYFRIQAKNLKGVGPMSPNQSYSPGSVRFVHPTGNAIKTKKGHIEDILSSIDGVALWPVIFILVAVVVILLFCLIFVCVLKKVSIKRSSTGYGGGRKASNGMNRNNDMWIQHGVGGASSHLLAETPSINDIKLQSRRGDGGTPSRYHTGTIHRGEDTYACVIGGRRVPSLPFDNESSLDSSRPLLSSRITHKSHPHMVQVAPPAPGSSTGGSERSGTLSRSYQHSSSSLDQRQRTPQMVFGVHGRGMGKVDLGESPYGSSIGLASGTPPPPNLAPPHPPIVSADGYRSVRGPTSIANMPSAGLRSFSNINGGLSTMRQIPVGRAQAQPRVNVATLCSPYLSSSAMSMEEDKMGLKEEERSNPSHLTLHPSISTEEMDEMGDVDLMINDLQALQQEFGVNS